MIEPSDIQPAASWTLADYLDWWIEVECVRHKPSSQRNAHYAAGRWGAALGHVRLADLTRAQLQEELDRQLAEGRAPSSVRLDWTYVSAALRLAVDDRVIEHNPVRRVRAPERSAGLFTLPTDAQLLAFLGEALAPDRRGVDRYGALIATALMTGMRRSELAGLRWRNVHLDGLDADAAVRPVRWTGPGAMAERLALGAVGEIDVVEQIFYVTQKRFSWPAPKSTSGRRRIPITADLADVLRAQYARVARKRARAGTRGWHENDLVFPTRRGLPPSGGVLDDGRKAIAAAVGLSPAPTFHLMRHAFISLLVEARVPLPTIVRLAGHIDGRMIERIYYTVMSRGMDDAAAAIQGRTSPTIVGARGLTSP